MITPQQIEQMTREEKLQVMEALWADLTKCGDGVDSPSWHEESLRETEARRAAGQERPVDWDVAKKELRKRSE